MFKRAQPGMMMLPIGQHVHIQVTRLCAKRHSTGATFLSKHVAILNSISMQRRREHLIAAGNLEVGIRCCGGPGHRIKVQDPVSDLSCR